MRVNLVLIGPPGSGKGTQAVRLARRFGISHISTGEILREAVRTDSPLGRQVAATLATGALVGDALMIDLVRERLAHADTAAGSSSTAFRAPSCRPSCSTKSRRRNR